MSGFDDLSALDLLFWLHRWNVELARLGIRPVADVDDARILPLAELRSVVASTEQRLMGER